MLQTIDVLTELDILGFDTDVLTTFGPTPQAVSLNLARKRRVAVEDWLQSALRRQGYSPQRHSVRWAVEKALSVVLPSTVTDLTAKLTDQSTDDVDLTALFAVPADSYLYVGMAEAPRGLWLTMQDQVNTTASTLTAEYWNGGSWAAFNPFADGTAHVSGKTFSGGGMLEWQQPDDWSLRQVSTDQTWRYWLRLKVSAALSSDTKLTQALAIRRSRLTTPAALYALSLLYGESWGTQQGEWKDKADRYLELANNALTGALVDLEEFVQEPGAAVDPVNTPAPPPDPTLTTWERG